MEPPPYFSRSTPICLLSDPAQRHNLCRRRRSSPPISNCFSCKGKKVFKASPYYYYCATCNLEFHRGCHKIPPEIRHPFHPFHPLTLTFLHPRPNSYKLLMLLMAMSPDLDSSSSGESIHEDDDDADEDNLYDDDMDEADYIAFYGDEDDYEAADSPPDRKNRTCKCCRKRLDNRYYHCFICKFSLNLSCTMTPTPPTISHIKSHEHALTLFPIRLPLPCDACGLPLDDTEDHVYSCLPCSHMIHRKCIYLPRVIKITRHQHRLSFTSSLPPGEYTCGVCRKAIDVNYGAYPCNKGCHYAVHSKCATREDVWDGIDLEDVPEEVEEVVEPFVRIDSETIQHFSHQQHYLRLHEKKSICEKDKFCEACTLPIVVSQRFYGCMECEFVLDEECASLPRIKHHPVHKHPLTLNPFSITEFGMRLADTSFKGILICNCCYRFSCGFQYVCGVRGCEFQIDVRCASIPDPFIHACHPHELFFNLTLDSCMGCGETCSMFYLECIICKTCLGMQCATLPCVAHYKHDRHPLTLCYGEEDTGGLYWCEVCETKVDPKIWFYKCGHCRITLHVSCLLDAAYIKPQQIIMETPDGDLEVEITRNDANTRRICLWCHRRCAHTLVIMMGMKHFDFCTFKCLFDVAKLVNEEPSDWQPLTL
ncbi:unnamed protein product [Microthlaspi erraticum]|uniref:Phorbol-ester/DAG-type domain-containing protein n=1 Tax=Microthlaspi erraticum TaxID=1685480 RepID=A0A6D2L835_9BRAS|nr:unnamed protein product [Microthlaspi erraticum]